MVCTILPKLSLYLHSIYFFSVLAEPLTQVGISVTRLGIFESFCQQFYNKSSPINWNTVWAFEKHHFKSKTVVATFLATFSGKLGYF